jgi:hypothetical protein
MPSFAGGKELAGLKGLLGRAGYGAGVFTAPSWMPAIFNQGQSSSATSAAVNRAAQTMPGLKPNPQTDIGRRLGNELLYAGGQIMQGRRPYTAPAQQAQQTGMYGRYARPSAQSSTPGVSAGPSSSPAAERAYQQEVSRVAQLTAQDPELQRYERARAGAKTQEDMNAARDIGMQIWAQRHGGLAANVKPGQSGYDAIQGTINAGAMGQPTEMGAFAGAQPSSLLFNPSNPLATAPPTGPVDYTTVAPSAFTGATGLGTESSYFGGAANQQQAKMFTRFQDAAPGGTPLQTGMNALLAPGSIPAPMASYQGAQGLSPVGTSLTPDANAYASSLASDKAQAQAEEFKKKLLSAQAK